MWYLWAVFHLFYGHILLYMGKWTPNCLCPAPGNWDYVMLYDKGILQMGFNEGHGVGGIILLLL